MTNIGLGQTYPKVEILIVSSLLLFLLTRTIQIDDCGLLDQTSGAETPVGTYCAGKLSCILAHSLCQSHLLLLMIPEVHSSPLTLSFCTILLRVCVRVMLPAFGPSRPREGGKTRSRSPKQVLRCCSEKLLRRIIIAREGGKCIIILQLK